MSSSSAPITFNGSSTYSGAFQQVITRAVAIASLPLQGLQTAVSTLTSQQSGLTSIGASFNALQSAVQALGSATGGNTTAQVSDSSVLTATASAGALAGTYTIQVDDPGSSTTTLSKAGLTTVTDPASRDISASSTFTLTVNGVTQTITNSGNSLASLVSSLNNANTGVQATIVNVGSAASADYRLAITSNSLGADSIQLNDGSQDLLDTLATGADAQYKVNGSATDVQSTSRQLALSPGLTVNLLAQSTKPVSITVSQDFSGLQSAISNVVSAYNATSNALAQSRGESGGALTGDPLVLTLTNLLQQITQFTANSGSVGSLADLGVTVSSTGELSFDPTAFSNDTSAVSQFLGGINSGGFLQVANNALSTITETTSGLIATDYNALQETITSDNSRISDQQDLVNALQTNLEQKLSQADAAIATLQAQATYFQQLFTAEYGGSGTNGSSSGV
ncbi:MAG TPA: flagellar filament capping protein FliD [Bryobacteraceae bacterium]|jgi:flagellar hook-associated protein 2|nr:flagellar filament capping protein FliD [Bryobacteraceae bacterium]